ncbi:ABC transporter substrate-binding protein [Haloarcula litorea]|uniref:ABC transporter substrate-binding protein n=1 Tax=Haloarcula litorea TaxID=3032579 RepID=UPI0023E8CA24|nr:ABC transporter substrate-binding protein [Halomicroarcula sp. GDY20]
MVRDTYRRDFIRGAGAATIIGLAGCGGDGSAGDGGGGDGESTSGDGGGSTGGTTSGTTTIEFWPAWGSYYEETFNEMVSDFESNHDVEVEMSLQGNYVDAQKAVFSAAKAGNAPDIAHLGKNSTIIARDTGYFKPIGDLMPDLDTSQYLGPAIGWSTVEGKLWSLPFNNSQIILYYNKNHFREAGLDPEQPPRTFQEVKEYSQQIVDAGVADKGITWPNVAWWTMSWLSEQNQLFCDQENGLSGEPTETFLASDAAETMFDWWVNDMSDLYHYPGKDDWGASEAAFTDGTASMHMNSSGGLAYLLSGFREKGIDVGVGRIPTPNMEHGGHSTGGAAVWVTDQDRSDAKQAAIREFLKSMTGPEKQSLYFKNTGYFPSHEGSITQLNEEGFFEDNPLYDTAFNQLQQWEPSPATKGIFMGTLPRTTDVIINQTDRMWQGKSVSQGLADMKSEADQMLESYERVSY